MEHMAAWPDLTLSQWKDTRDTLHLWTQIVGKVRLGLMPMTASDPDALLLSFFQSTYEGAAELGGWDRPALEIVR